MRILLVTTSLLVGGAENQVYLLGRELRKRGHEVHIASLTPPTAYVDELTGIGVEVSCLGVNSSVSAIGGLLKLRRLVTEWKPDVVHAHMFHAIFLSRLSQLLGKRVPLVSTTHNYTAESAVRNALYRVTDRLGALTTNVSLVGRAQYVRTKAAPEPRIVRVPNGIDLGSFSPQLHLRELKRAELGLGDEFVWLAVGRMEEPKDYPTLIGAVSELRAKGSESKLLVVGEGSLEREVRRQAEELVSMDVIRFLGTRTDVSELMSASDAYVMSSSSEGLPLVLLEAAASGLPIVATEVGGNPEVVEDGTNGALVPAASPKKLANAMWDLERLSPEALSALGEAGQKRVCEVYEIGRVVGIWEQMYQSLFV